MLFHKFLYISKLVKHNGILRLFSSKCQCSKIKYLPIYSLLQDIELSNGVYHGVRTEEVRWPTLSTRLRIPWNSAEVLGALYPVTDSWVSKIMSHNWQFPRKKDPD